MLTYEQKLIAAVWMVGNMDTAEDKAFWWATFGDVWNHIKDHEPDAQRYADEQAGRIHGPDGIEEDN